MTDELTPEQRPFMEAFLKAFKRQGLLAGFGPPGTPANDLLLKGRHFLHMSLLCSRKNFNATKNYLENFLFVQALDSHLTAGALRGPHHKQSWWAGHPAGGFKHLCKNKLQNQELINITIYGYVLTNRIVNHWVFCLKAATGCGKGMASTTLDIPFHDLALAHDIGYTFEATFSGAPASPTCNITVHQAPPATVPSGLSGIIQFPAGNHLDMKIERPANADRDVRKEYLARVESVEPGGQCAKAGVKTGDFLVFPALTGHHMQHMCLEDYETMCDGTYPIVFRSMNYSVLWSTKEHKHERLSKKAELKARLEEQKKQREVIENKLASQKTVAGALNTEIPMPHMVAAVAELEIRPPYPHYPSPYSPYYPPHAYHPTLPYRSQQSSPVPEHLRADDNPAPEKTIGK